MKRLFAAVLLLALTLSACGDSGQKSAYIATFPLYVATVEYDGGQLSSSDLATSRKMAEFAADIIESNSVLEQVIEKTGADLTKEQLKEMISAELEGETCILAVSVTADEMQLAMEVAQALVEVAPEQIAKTIDGISVRLLEHPTVTKKKTTWDNIFGR